MKILGITGHRPKKLYGYDNNHPGNLFVIHAIGDFLKENKPDKVISGMALGVDQWSAQWCIKLNIPFIAALPVKEQERLWSPNTQKLHKWLLNKASECVVVTNENELTDINTAMEKRNHYIVDNCNLILAVFGGYAGGTRNCLKYAKSKGKYISIINPGDYFKYPN